MPNSGSHNHMISLVWFIFDVLSAPRARTPLLRGNVVYAPRIGRRTTRIKHRLHEFQRRNLRRYLRGGNDTEPVVGKRCNNDKSPWRIKQCDFFAAQRPFHAHIGRYKAFLIFAAGEGDARSLTHRAMHAVTTDQPLRLDRLDGIVNPDLGFNLRWRRRITDQFAWPQYTATEILEVSQ